MFIRKGLYLQLNWLSNLGILPVYKNQNQLHLLPKRSKQWYKSFLAFIISTLILLWVLYMILKALWFGHTHPNIINGAIDIKKLYSNIITIVTQLLSNFLLYLRKELNLKILESAVRLENKHINVYKIKKQKIWHDFTFRLFFIFLLLLIMWSINLIQMIINNDVKVSSFEKKMCVSLISISKLLYGGLQLTFYASLVKILNRILHLINKKLENCSKSNDEKELHLQIRQLLIDRNEIIRLCENDISSLYGFLLLLDLLSMIVSLAVGFVHVFFLLRNSLKVLGSFNWFYIFTTEFLVWITPILFYSVLIFKEDVTKEANKTARILSRISRRGTDIEKMVDKFLLKNINQKPILTAYGFFPLNKRTLFKIFAAIFTYMVILIQFKDMESTNKRHNEVKTSTTTLAATTQH